ncbi:MAG: hypothetical protein HFH91_07200 [Lachnospiraceae bacterium]|nr:hypothetical protein [Lachnospiraceae bacterium]
MRRRLPDAGLYADHKRQGQREPTKGQKIWRHEKRELQEEALLRREIFSGDCGNGKRIAKT